MRKDLGELDFRRNPRPAAGDDSASRSQQGGGGGDQWQAFEKLILATKALKGSDLHLRAGTRPCVRIDGDIHPLADFDVLVPADIERLMVGVVRPHEMEKLRRNLQVDTSVGSDTIGRVRINAFFQRGSIAVAMRMIRTDIPSPEELGVPGFVRSLTRLRAGLVLVAGATGTGKSTTLAALTNDINRTTRRHIITIEDPIEFLFRDDKSIFAQREIGIDAHTFPEAMSAALREDPDVILVSDLRDNATFEFALTAAETGHLVLGTVHAPTTYDTVTRLVASFPPEAQPTIRAKLSQNLRVVIGQRLVPAANGEGRILACEVLSVSARVRELILDPLKIADIGEMLRNTRTVEGMISFDQQLLELFSKGRISAETALKFATSATDLKLRLQGFSG